MKNPRGDKSVALLPGNRVLVMGGETHNRGLYFFPWELGDVHVSR